MKNNVPFSPEVLVQLNQANAIPEHRWEVLDEVAFLGPQENPISGVFVAVYQHPNGEFVVVQQGSCEIAFANTVLQAIAQANEYAATV